MNRVVTVRLSDEEYRKIEAASRFDHRPISNFMATMTLKQIEESSFVDAIEMAQIKSDKRLLKKLKKGHQDAKELRGRLIG